MKRFDEKIKEKLEQFEYPYEEIAWKQFSKKNKIKSIIRSSIIATSTIGIICILYFYFNNTNNSIQDNNLYQKNVQIYDSANVEKTTNLTAETNKNQPSSKKTHKTSTTINYQETIETNTQEKNNLNNNKQLTNSSPLDEKTNKYSINVSTNQGCMPLTVWFSSNNIPNNAILLWNFGDGNTSTEANPIYTYKKSGKYQVSLKVKINEQEIIINETTSIIVYPRPIARFNYKQTNNTITLENKSKQFGSIRWKFADTIITEESWSFNITNSGKYQVKLIAENQYSCNDTINRILELTYYMPVQLAEAFTPDGDGINDLFGPQVLDYSEYFFTMQIFQKTGRLVFEGKGSPIWWDGIDFSTKQQFASDVYFYKIIAVDKIGNKQEFSGKIQLIR